MNPLDPWYHIGVPLETPPHIVLLAARLRQERQHLAYQHWLEQRQRSEHQQYVFGRTTPWAVLQLEMLLQQEAYAWRQALLLQQLEQMREQWLGTNSQSYSSSLGEGSLLPFPAHDHVIDSFVNDGGIHGTHTGATAATPPAESGAHSNSDSGGSRPGRSPSTRTLSPATGPRSSVAPSSCGSAQSAHRDEDISPNME